MKKPVSLSFDEFYRRIKTETPFTTQEKLGQALGITRSGVSWIKNQLHKVPEDWINKLEKHGYSREWLINGTGPKYSNIAGLYVSSDYLKVRTVRPDLSNLNEKEYYSFSAPWLAKKGTKDDLVMIPVDSDDLSPEIRKGDVVMVDTKITEPRVGKMFVLSLQGQFLFRKCRLNGSGFELVDAAGLEGISFPTADNTILRVLGQITWFGRDLG